MNQAALQAETHAIMIDEVFPHAPEIVWKTLTSGELMARWLGMTPTDFAPVVGQRFTYATTPAGEWDGTIRCKVLEVTPNRRFAYSWKGGHEANAGYGSRLDTIVAFTLDPAEDGTRLRVVHSGFVLPHNETAYDKMTAGWTKVLERLGEAVREKAA